MVSQCGRALCLDEGVCGGKLSAWLCNPWFSGNDVFVHGGSDRGCPFRDTVALLVMAYLDRPYS